MNYTVESALPNQVSNDAIACPLCGNPIDPLIAKICPSPSPRAVRILNQTHPTWHPTQGVCPTCAAEAAETAQQKLSSHSLAHELLAPFPVYAEDDLRLLSTPQRVGANPQYQGRGVTIALLDSGFYPHPDLTRPVNRIAGYVDATLEEPAEQNLTKQANVENWHGLMTSCVAAGNGFMSKGFYTSLAPQAKVILIKTGSPRTRRIRDGDIQRALSWVIANQQRYEIQIVNISLGGDSFSFAADGRLSTLDALVEDAVARGMVVIVAAGNDGLERIHAPAGAPAAITVGGLDDRNSRDPKHHQLYRSNYGKGALNARKPDLIAPAIWLAAPMLPNSETHKEGEFLARLLAANDKQFARLLDSAFAQDLIKSSTLRLPIDEIRIRVRKRMIEQKFIHPHYQHVDGTSFAAPIVSATVAQMLEANPTLTPAQIKQILLDTAQPLQNVPAEKQGHGAINAGQAVAVAARAPHGLCAGLPLSPYHTRWATNFYYADASAYDVSLVGSFNGWQPNGYALQARGRGVWQITLPALPAGTYAYKFIVNRSHWTHDSENIALADDGFGGFNSQIVITD